MSATGVGNIPNEVFLEALFADALPGTHTIVCSFLGDPLAVPRERWWGQPWSPGDKLPHWFHKGNTYVTVSTFEPDPQTGEMRRRKANFVAMHAVMVDDVGTKVPRGKLALAPSALIETSPSNFQAFYFLSQGLRSRDRPLCERLVEQMIAAGLTADGKDLGMRGVTRYGRLPVGINAKARYVEQLGKPFQVRCALFEPTRRYTIADIAAAWRLDLTLHPLAPVIPISAAQAKRACRSFSALLRTLELMNMYRGRIGSGPWHDIRCPWVHEHTEGADSGTAVGDPSIENNFSGGFQCHHGHCEYRTMRDMWAWVRALSQELERGAR
jgi:hypothetical protein